MSAHRISLFDNLSEIESLARLIEQTDESEELTPQHREAIEAEIIAAIAGTREKIDRTAAVLASFEAAELAASRELERLSSRKAAYERNRKRLEQYCLAVISASNLKQLDGFTSTLKPRNNPPAVMVDADAELPAEFLREPKPMPASPDKTAIKAALQRGEFVPGCRIQQTVRLVRQ